MTRGSAPRRRTLGISALALATAAAGFTVAAGPAHAAGGQRYVAKGGTDAGGSNDCTDKSGPCATIQHAVDIVADEFSAGDTIHVAGGTYHQSTVVNVDVTIVGAGANATHLTGNGSADPTFYVSGPSLLTVTLRDLDISGNETAAGVHANSADVRIDRSHVDRNTGFGAGAESAVIKGTHTTFSGNRADDDGADFDDGAGLIVQGVAILDHSTVNANDGAGIFEIVDDKLAAGGRGDRRAAAAGSPTATVTIDHSTVSNNAYTGVYNSNGAVTSHTSTFSGNRAAAIANLGGIADVANSTLTNTKPGLPHPLGVFAKRARSEFAAIVNFPPDGMAPAIAASTDDLDYGDFRVTGSIVAGQQTGAADCLGPVMDSGYNISSDAHNTCHFSSGKHDLVKKNPKLGNLADNGGATKTLAPEKGSPVIDYVRSGKANCIRSATDQRDKARVQPVGGRCDIGAVELAAKPLAIHPDSLPHGTVGKKYSQTLTASGGQFPSYTFELVRGHLPSGLTLHEHGKLSGTPTKADTFEFTVRVNDSVSHSYKVAIKSRH